MRYAPGRRRHFAPAVHERPANKPPRACIVAKVASERAKKEPDVLIKRVELILQRPPRPKQIAANLAVHLQNKRRFRLVVGVISREKIGEQLSIFVDRVDRHTQKSSLATELPHSCAIGTAVTADRECFLVIHSGPFPCSVNKGRGKCKTVARTPAASHAALPPVATRPHRASAIFSRSILRSHQPAPRACFRAPTIPGRAI